MHSVGVSMLNSAATYHDLHTAACQIVADLQPHKLMTINKGYVAPLAITVGLSTFDLPDEQAYRKKVLQECLPCL